MKAKNYMPLKFGTIEMHVNDCYLLHISRYFGRYVATLLVVVKKDFFWIVGVFIILNLSIGGGLYFAIQGSNNMADQFSNNGR